MRKILPPRSESGKLILELPTNAWQVSNSNSSTWSKASGIQLVNVQISRSWGLCCRYTSLWNHGLIHN